MKRYDLRGHKSDFNSRLLEILKVGKEGEVFIFLFEIVSAAGLQEVINSIKESGAEVLNSLKFNEADWTIVVKVSNV
ncbi:MAG: NADH-ubiquinone oxidoreductase subunit E family protein [Campylobacteraceae bacterium]|jgi:NADH-quinone oxidoreductase subunit E|nr:NADH-ubiquinone oxidoreductase subunit E family protein [Campylobacteraceae bacterium]